MALRSLPSYLALALCGCASNGAYKKTNRKLEPVPRPVSEVAVYRQASEVSPGFVQLGRYRGKAPTVAEALDGARRQCAKVGAPMFILSTLPFKAGERGYKVEGVCAVPAP